MKTLNLKKLILCAVLAMGVSLSVGIAFANDGPEILLEEIMQDISIFSLEYNKDLVYDNLDTYQTGHVCPIETSLIYNQPLQYRTNQRIAQLLEDLSRYYPYAPDSYKPLIEEMTLAFYGYLTAQIDLSEEAENTTTGTLYPLGIYSDSNLCYGGFDTLSAWHVLRAFYYYYQINPDNGIKNNFIQISDLFMDYVDANRGGDFNIVNKANANNRATHMDVLYMRHKMEPSLVTRDDVALRKQRDYDYIEQTKIWDTSQFLCGVPLGFGSWMHNDPPTPTGRSEDLDCGNDNFANRYHQLVGYHYMIVEGLSNYRELLMDMDLCWDDEFVYHNGERSICDQTRWTLMGAISWLNQLQDEAGFIGHVWPSFPQETPNHYGTVNGLKAYFEMLQVVDDGTYNHFPYYSDFPLEPGATKNLTYDDMWDNIFISVDYANSIDNLRKNGLRFTSSYYSVFYSPTIRADFEASPTSGGAPLAVDFEDLSAGGTSYITSWSWDFGDSGTSTQQNPTHIYTNPDTYTVALTVTGPEEQDTYTRLGYITASIPPPPTVSVSIDDGYVRAGEPIMVTITGASAAGLSSVEWWAEDINPVRAEVHGWVDGVWTTDMHNPQDAGEGNGTTSHEYTRKVTFNAWGDYIIHVKSKDIYSPPQEAFDEIQIRVNPSPSSGGGC